MNEFSKEEMQSTIDAQREYIIELEKKYQDLQIDFDITAKRVIGFARDLGVEELISKNKGADGNLSKTQEAKIYADMGLKFMRGKINFSKLEVLVPLFDKYKDQYTDV